MKTGLFLCALLIGSIDAMAAQRASGPQFPTRPVRMIVANGPGSAPDVIARLLGAKLTDLWGQPVVIDNRTGATGLIAIETLVKSAPDGHTMFLSTMTQLISTLMYQRLQLATETEAVTLVGTTPFALVVNASLPVKSVAEWIAYARARQGQLLFGSGGQWGSSHLCLESFNALTGLKMTHVPYKATSATLADLIGGQIHIYCPAAPSLPAFTAGGRIRVLGVTYKQPTKLVPGVPPVADTVPGFELLGWYGMNLPPKTPKDIVARINADVVKALKDPELQEKMIAVGAEAAGTSPADFLRFLQSQTEHWRKLLKESGAIQPKG
ncbi:MAG TPA: tripartite tricarboxylate transporter substrate-binding protein [Burkholderiales bacterium]|nr:tripartite tricarboxylate transporter substrate-binding protein [Burkholderiales bacterium]